MGDPYDSIYTGREVDAAVAAHTGGASSKNLIINGNMDVWQRGTSFVSPANIAYTADRWQAGYLLGDGTFTITQDTDVPTAAEFGGQLNHSLKVDCTHIETAVAAGEFAILRHVIEGYNFKNIEGQAATISFWVKAVKAGIYCVAARNSAGDQSYISEFTINAASTWEKKTITITFDSGGTFLYTNGTGLRLDFVLACGATYQVAADAWQVGLYLATANQVNGLDNVANNFWLTGVKLERGSVATPFEIRSFGQELDLCQRYYYRFSAATAYQTYASGYCQSTTVAKFILPFPTTMRTAPTALEQSGTPTDYQIAHQGTATDCSVVAVIAVSSMHSGILVATVAAGLTAGDSVQLRAGNVTGGYLGWSAEL